MYASVCVVDRRLAAYRGGREGERRGCGRQEREQPRARVQRAEWWGRAEPAVLPAVHGP